MQELRRSRTSTALVVVAAVALALASPAARPAHAGTPDPLERKVRAQLSSFTAWLETNDARGYVGEIGWADNYRGEAADWNRLADGWLAQAGANDLWVSGWATGEWWDDYRLSMYENRTSQAGVDSVNSQASTFEAAAAAAGAKVGITVNGGEFGSPITARESRFSNRNPGAYNTRYHYDRQGTFDYLARRGMGHVRIPFRWERIQPRLGGPLDEQEVARLRAAVGRASAAGLRSILDVHNYGAYYLHRDGRGVRMPVGSPRCTIADFADLWRRISKAFRGDQRVLMYALMAEPFGMPSVGGASPAAVWEKASRRALLAIRKTGDRHLIAVPGYGWSALQVFTRKHKDGWIKDPANNFVYEVHHYWDHDHSGNYNRSYADEVEAARRSGW